MARAACRGASRVQPASSAWGPVAYVPFHRPASAGGPGDDPPSRRSLAFGGPGSSIGFTRRADHAPLLLAPLAVEERPAARTPPLLREERFERRDGVDHPSTGPAREPGHGLNPSDGTGGGHPIRRPSKLRRMEDASADRTPSSAGFAPRASSRPSGQVAGCGPLRSPLGAARIRSLVRPSAGS